MCTWPPSPSPLASAQEARALRRRVVAAGRKLLFFLSWANELPEERYAMLAAATAAELAKHAGTLSPGEAGGEQAGLAGLRLRDERGSGGVAGSHGGPLIEEL